MAIAFDAVSGGKDNGGAVTSITFSHTCTGANLVLVVVAYIDNIGGTSITGVTYNGVAMTQVATVTGGTRVQSYSFILVNPATGAHNVVVSANQVIGGNQQIAANSMSYTGCAQTGQPDSNGTNGLASSTVTNFPVSTTVVASNCWLVGGGTENAGDIAGGVAGAGTTYRGVVQFNQYGADSNGTVGTGSQSLNWGRAGTSGDISGTVMSLAPVATPNTGFLMFM